jgi:hypothetical protein
MTNDLFMKDSDFMCEVLMQRAEKAVKLKGRTQIRYLGLLGFWTLSIAWYSKNHHCGNWIYLSLGEGVELTLLGLLETANLNHWTIHAL